MSAYVLSVKSCKEDPVTNAELGKYVTSAFKIADKCFVTCFENVPVTYQFRDYHAVFYHIFNPPVHF